MSPKTHALVVGPNIKTLRSTPSSITLRTCIRVLTLAGLMLLPTGASFAYAQTGETGSVPVTPDGPTGAALWMGMMDVEWNEAPGAETYEVQYFHMMSDWADLPGNGIRIAFYGAGAVVSGLSPSSSYTFRVRAVNSHGESQWSDFGWVPQTDGPRAWSDVPEPTNVAATGAPTISGTMAPGEALTADTSAIYDENGLDRVKFHYQWISSDGTTDTDIEGATGRSYTLTEADEGKTIKLRVSFTDRHGFAESLANTELLINTVNSNYRATGAPTVSGEAWVGETLTAGTSDIQDEDGLTDVEYEYQWVFVGERADEDIEGATNATYTLPEVHLGKAIRVRVTFTDDIDNEESLVSEATAEVTWRPNAPANRSSNHQRHSRARTDADCEDVGHPGRRRTGQRLLQLPVDCRRRNDGDRYCGSHELDLCPCVGIPGQGCQSAGQLHRRSRLRRVFDQPCDGSSDMLQPTGANGGRRDGRANRGDIDRG